MDKFKTCEDCQDRHIEPINCHTTCEGYKYRQKKAEELNQKRLADKELYSFKKIAVRETKAKVGK